MKYIILILLVFLLGCEDHTTIPAYNPQRNIYALRYGRTITINPPGIKISFDDLLSDSRCPTGAYCYWEGMAEIKLSLIRQNMDTVFIKPSIAGYVTRYHGYHASIDTIGIHVKLLQLDPYPRLGVKYHKSDYVALLELSQN